MKLYHDPISTTARAVRFFLFDEEIEHEEEVFQLFAGDHLSPAFGALNPNHQVPVLVDGDFTLTECSAILKYVADKVHSPAYPDELKARARVNEAMDWFGTCFMFAYGYLGAYVPMLPEMRAMNAVTRADIEHLGALKSRHYLTVLNDHMLGGKRFLCGGEITIADYLGATFVSLGDYVDFELTRYPNIVAWLARMKARQGWDAAFAAFNGFVSAARAARAA